MYLPLSLPLLLLLCTTTSAFIVVTSSSSGRVGRSRTSSSGSGRSGDRIAHGGQLDARKKGDADGDVDAPPAQLTRARLLSKLSTLSVGAVVGAAALGTEGGRGVLRAEPAGAKPKRVKNAPLIPIEGGGTWQDITVGDGVSPSSGDRVAIHYSLFCSGLEVESSRESSGLAARPLGFDFGAEAGPGSIPKALQVAMEGMKVGGRRKINLPPSQAYGKAGRGPLVPPDSSVVFDVQLLSVKKSGTNVNITLPGQSFF